MSHRVSYIPTGAKWIFCHPQLSLVPPLTFEPFGERLYESKSLSLFPGGQTPSLGNQPDTKHGVLSCLVGGGSWLLHGVGMFAQAVCSTYQLVLSSKNLVVLSRTP